ncbi:MAG: MFS transporter [Verrucomicrobia bacterium]|nr:MFS transporter [Verrucomicrobiota bacterium]
MLFNQRKIKRALFPVLLTYFLDNFGLAIIYPIFTPLLIKSEHSILSYATPYFERNILLGLLIASFPLAQFFGAPIIGQFSDRFGRKRAFYITILGTALGYTLTAVCIMTHSLTGLFISRFCTGLFAGNLTLCLAAIADLSPDDTSRTRNFSLISAIGGMSFIIAIMFGGIFSDPNISSHFNPSFPFWITAILSYINLVCMIVLFHETHKTPRHPGLNPLKGIHNLIQGVQSRELRVIYTVNFLFMLAWVASMQFLPAYLLEHFKFKLGDITLCLMGVGAIWSLSNLIINRRLAKNLYPGQLLLGSLLLLSLSLLFTMMTHGSTTFLIFFFPAVCFASLCWTNGLATISLKAPSAIQGSILGINQSMTSIAAMLSPILGGILTAINQHGVYVFGGISALAAFCILLSYRAYEHHSYRD